MAAVGKGNEGQYETVGKRRKGSLRDRMCEVAAVGKGRKGAVRHRRCVWGGGGGGGTSRLREKKKAVRDSM